MFNRLKSLFVPKNIVEIANDVKLAITVGSLVGDALGVPFEFKPSESIPERDLISFKLPEHYPRSHHGSLQGTWSDDGALFLALVDAIRKHPEQTRLDMIHFSKNMCDWLMNGKFTIDAQVFDVGIQTNLSLTYLVENGYQAWEASGQTAENSNGNGSLMRCMACLWVDNASLDDILKMAALQSIPTHRHVMSVLCCQIACYIAIKLTQGFDKSNLLIEAINYLRSKNTSLLPAVTFAKQDWQHWLNYIENYPKQTTPEGSGFVVDSLWSAWYSFYNANDFKQAVQNAVKMGNDTDTTACIAGGFAGAHYGFDPVTGIPSDWIEDGFLGLGTVNKIIVGNG